MNVWMIISVILFVALVVVLASHNGLLKASKKKKKVVSEQQYQIDYWRGLYNKSVDTIRALKRHKGE